MLADLVFVLCSYFFHVDFIQIVSILVLSDPSVYVNLTLSRRLKKNSTYYPHTVSDDFVFLRLFCFDYPHCLASRNILSVFCYCSTFYFKCRLKTLKRSCDEQISHSCRSRRLCITIRIFSMVSWSSQNLTHKYIRFSTNKFQVPTYKKK